MELPITSGEDSRSRHGRANGILLPHIVEYNADLKDYQQKEVLPGGKEIVQDLLSCWELEA